MILISIDPSTKRNAVAVWKDGKLVETHLLRSDLKDVDSSFEQSAALGNATMASHIAIEMPMIYPRRKGKKNPRPNDLMKLSFHAGFIAGAFYDECHTELFLYLAKEWKGTVSKEIMLPRIQARLTEEEFNNVTLTKNKECNLDIWDAVGIGLHHLGRL